MHILKFSLIENPWILPIAVAIIAWLGPLLLLILQWHKEKTNKKLTVCNDIMAQSYLLTAYYKIVLRSNIEFRYHERLFRLEIDSNFNKELMISYMKQFDSLEMDFYKETAALLNSIEVYQILFGQNEIIEENRIILENQKVTYKVNYHGIKYGDVLDTKHEDNRTKLSTYIKEELHPPHLIIQKIVETKRKKLKIY